MKTLLLALFAIGALALLPNNNAVAADHTKDPLPTVQENIKSGKAVLVDVREKEEWESGHLADATSLPLSEIQAGTAKPTFPKDKIIYTHCASGIRSVSAANLLEKQGYNVHSLKPGYSALVEAGFPKAAK